MDGARREDADRTLNADRTLGAEAARALLDRIRGWAEALGFSQIGVADVDLSHAEAGLLDWLANGFHGTMSYMRSHGLRRARPAELVPGTVRVLTVRMDYLPRDAPADWQAVEWRRLGSPGEATVSVYARGRDYHKVLRQRLQRLTDRIADAIGPFGHRVFTDSAPVMEVELAAASGIGWRGKHTLALHRDAGSMFFLGEIFIDIALPLTDAATPHCGSCTACIEVCPTQAILAPYRLDARRCISYLTIEHAGPIAVELRPLIGNRVYGCDDCQLVCPWNRYARPSTLADFDARPPLDGVTLLELWRWDEAEFSRHTEGSAIRRIGFERWQRNLAVALGNALRDLPGDVPGDVPADAPADAPGGSLGDTPGDARGAAPIQPPRGALSESEAATIRGALAARRDGAGALVREHIDWALHQAGGDATRCHPASTA